MNEIRLMGGLGNQLFQYALGRAMELTGAHVVFNTRWYSDKINPHRPMLLNWYTANINFNHGPILHQKVFRDYDHGFKPGVIQLKDGIFDGYWQFYGYFKDILPTLREDLVLKPEYRTPEFDQALRQIEKDKHSISLHVRRGDYLNQTGWGVLPLRYYLSAIRETKGNLYIFSDDIPWCVEHFKNAFFPGRKIFFVHHCPVLDLELMRACRTNIIANSTFSYWAAILNDYKHKHVICPNKWLGNLYPDTNEMHYPKEWTKIEAYVD